MEVVAFYAVMPATHGVQPAVYGKNFFARPARV